MKSYYQVVRSSLLALALVATLAPSQIHALGSTPVTVVNPNPISVDITGTPNVNVTNTVPVSGSVSINNSSDIAKAQGIQHQFQTNIVCSTSNNFNCVANYIIPANQRLVLEYVEADCTLWNNQLPGMFTIQTDFPSLSHILNIDPNQVRFIFGNQHYAQSQPVKFYADAGTVPRIIFTASNISTQPGFPNCRFNLSGQLIDVP